MQSSLYRTYVLLYTIIQRDFGGMEVERIILHCDLNNFFASVECLDHPELRGHPMAVCGSVEDRHGIVLSKNELAKKYGVKTAETVWQARRKCPDLRIAPPHYERYVHFSNLMHEIYQTYTDQIEPFGIDECWLDVSGSTRLFGGGREIADEIRKRAREELNLTVSVGVSFNKIFAKLGSDMKKPDATTVIDKGQVASLVWPLPACEMMGVGGSTADKLRAMGILTLGDIAQAKEKYLTARLGKFGHTLWVNASGLDDSPVALDKAKEAPKSIGNSTTCVRDVSSQQEAKQVLLFLSDKVGHRLRAHGLAAGGVQISIRDVNLNTEEHQTVLTAPTTLSEDLGRESVRLFSKFYHWQRPVRALGVRAFHLVDENSMNQLSFFKESALREKARALERETDGIRERFGKRSLLRASLISGLPLMKEDREYRGFGFAYEKNAGAKEGPV